MQHIPLNDSPTLGLDNANATSARQPSWRVQLFNELEPLLEELGEPLPDLIDVDEMPAMIAAARARLATRRAEGAGYEH